MVTRLATAAAAAADDDDDDDHGGGGDVTGQGSDRLAKLCQTHCYDERSNDM